MKRGLGVLIIFILSLLGLSWVLGSKHGTPQGVIALKANSILKIYGVSHGDSVISINGTPVHSRSELAKVLTIVDQSRPLNIDLVRRGKLDESYSIAIPVNDLGFNERGLGLDNPELFVGTITKNSLAEKLGILELDRLVLVQGQPVATFDGENFVRNLKAEGTLRVSVIRGDQLKSLELKLDRQFDGVMSGLGSYCQFMGIRPLVSNDSENGSPSASSFIVKLKSRLGFI